MLSLEASLEQYFPKETARRLENPLVTVDIVLLTLMEGALKILLIQRQSQPYQGMWSIPGGFIYTGETLEDAATRSLREKTSVTNLYLEQLQAFGQPSRDPRARVITVAYYALIASPTPSEDGNAWRFGSLSGQWFDVLDLPSLAFDHAQIVDTALKRLQERSLSTGIVGRLLPEKFTLTELQRAYESVLNKKLDKRNFRKKVLASGMLTQLEEKKMDGYHRPAQLFSLNWAYDSANALASVG
jgi:8-oxo-dGTP diphosphatase